MKKNVMLTPFVEGDGVDEIWDDDTGPEKSILVFGEGFDPNSIKLRTGSLLLDLGPSTDSGQARDAIKNAGRLSDTRKSRRWRDGGGRLQMQKQSSERRAA
jgi:hypothetical protein